MGRHTTSNDGRGVEFAPPPGCAAESWMVSGEKHRSSVRDLSRLIESLQASAAELPRGDVLVLLLQLSSVLCTLGARLAIGSDDERQVPPEGFLTLSELAQRMKLGKSTIRAMVASGELQQNVHYRRVRRRLLFLWAPIERTLGQRTTAAASPDEIVPFFRRGRRHA